MARLKKGPQGGRGCQQMRPVNCRERRIWGCRCVIEWPTGAPRLSLRRVASSARLAECWGCDHGFCASRFCQQNRLEVVTRRSGSPRMRSYNFLSQDFLMLFEARMDSNSFPLACCCRLRRLPSSVPAAARIFLQRAFVRRYRIGSISPPRTAW